MISTTLEMLSEGRYATTIKISNQSLHTVARGTAVKKMAKPVQEANLSCGLREPNL
jgi:hypothetical protein